jgi:phosphate/phosphite/phosphonate ABC transporter binding protein
MQRPLVFGYVGKPGRPAVHRLLDAVGRNIGIRITVHESASYEELGRAVQTRDVDLAWIPPIAFIAVDRHGLVVPLVSPARSGGSDGSSSLTFTAVIIVPKRSSALGLRKLAGCRAAWVDRFSASGYVAPRLELDGAGVDLEGFASETFYGSHIDVVRAVATGAADFGGTFVTFGPRGEIVRSAWHDQPELASRVRVLARVGALPAEVIAARSDMPAALQTELTRAFVTASRDDRFRATLHQAFGADELKPWKAPGYDLLRAETERAALAGLI